MMMDAGGYTAVVDVRCLQDSNYVHRGVGRHALALLRHAPRGECGFRLVGLADPDMQPLEKEARGLLDDCCVNAHVAAQARSFRRSPDCFVSLSPMTHDPLFVAGFLTNKWLLRTAVVYDFIPQRQPDRYLPAPEQRLRYANGLRWLARHDLFAPISRSARDDLAALLRVPASAMTITGASLAPVFENARDAASATGWHVLVIGGGDARKNPEVVVRAHARSAAMQRGAGIPIVIGGNYDDAQASSLRALAAAHGGRPELVEVPGHVSEAELLELYRQALVIVSGSRDEGFSLPVVEGMAAGVPCLVSDIPAHRELVDDPAQYFAPDDDAALAAALDRVLDDGPWRDAVLARQATVWPHFAARSVAERFWGAVRQGLGVPDPVRAASDSRRAAAGVLRGLRPRVALLTPLPPDRSGVADYTAASCAELGQLVDLHVFTETTHPSLPLGASAIRRLDSLPHLLPGFDRVVSVIGNSHFHLRIFDLLRRYGAACIAHDARMLGFYRVLLGTQRALAVASGELGRPVEEAELNGWMTDESKLKTLFLGEVIEASSPTIVHSPVTVRLAREMYGASLVHVPFSVYRPWPAANLSPAARAAARARLDLPAGEVVIATFGFVHDTKAPDECIWALEVLRGWGIPASLHFVGDIEPMPNGGAGLRALIARLGLTDQVRFLGSFVSEQIYRDYLVGADLGLQLRTYGLGGLSGAVLDCAAAGLPTVTNDALGAAVQVPELYFRTVSDALSPVHIAEGLAALLEAGLAARRPEAAREAFCADRSLSSYARKLCGALGLEAPAMRAAAA